METEIEVKFVDISIDEVREKLKTAGAKLMHPMTDMKRVMMDHPDLRLQNAEHNSYVRVRDEGTKTTLTFKRFETLEFGGAKELEVEVSDFETTVKIFEEAGLVVCSYQETRRETWSLNGVEIVIDEWPWLNPYVEIEGQKEESIKEVAKLLGFDWDDAVFGAVMSAYRHQYPHLNENQTVGQIESVKFGDPLPDMFVVK